MKRWVWWSTLAMSLGASVLFGAAEASAAPKPSTVFMSGGELFVYAGEGTANQIRR